MKHLIPVAALLTLSAIAPQNTEEFARRQYDSGLAFLQSEKYSEALKDFQAVIDSYPASQVADDALLEMAKYQLDIARDSTAAQVATDALLKKYPSGDAAPMAHVLSGRVVLARGHAPADIDAALASFERVPRLFPGTDVVPAAMFYAGEALRIGRRPADAIERYRQVSREYPGSPWAARAALGAGRALALTGQAARAMEEIQRVRVRFPGTPEATRALGWNTILYRLFVRRPSYGFSGRALGSKVKDVEAVEVDARGSIFVASRNALLVFDKAGQARPAAAAQNLRALLFDPAGALVSVTDTAFVGGAGSAALALPPAKAGDKPRMLEDVVDAATLSLGDRLVADKRTLQRFTPAGKYLGVFATIEVSRIAVTELDDVAALGRDKSITIFTPEGRAALKIPQKGDGYDLQEPVDIAFDALGYLYVLDREHNDVVVFNQQGKVVTVVTPAGKAGGMSRPVAFGVDSAGRLYVADEKAQQILIYQ